MFRKLIVLAFSAVISLGTLAATTTPSAAGHRDGISVGVGVGFGNGYVRFGTPHRYHHPRIRHHPRYYHRRYYDPYPRYHVPVYRKYRPPVVYHQPRIRYRSGDAHVQWCYGRYRSYRAYDNTFQPYHGPRKQCWSPYS